jgi:hypothetical protein
MLTRCRTLSVKSGVACYKRLCLKINATGIILIFLHYTKKKIALVLTAVLIYFTLGIPYKNINTLISILATILLLKICNV